MKEKLIGIGVLLGLIFCIGGFGVLGEALNLFVAGFKGFFPIFFDIAKSSIEDYLTSAYFITSVIMAVASAGGIWFGAKGGKWLFFAVSIILEIISLISILTNLI